MKQIRYRTESFSGLGERDAAEVMSYETFELGNVCILDTLLKNVLKDRGEITKQFLKYIDELEGNNCKEETSFESGIDFFKKVLKEIQEVTGLNIKYVLWLADKEAVIDRTFYGMNMLTENDIDAYEIGPIVLSELGYDGTLYGYEEYPVSLNEKLERLKDELTNIINERESDNVSYERASYLDEKYLEIDKQIQEIKDILEK